METSLILGFGFVVLGAICGGSYALPSKFAKDTPWENLWGPFFFFVTLIIPTVFGPLVVHDILATWSAVGPGVLIWPILFGFLWGFGSMTFGLSFGMIGLSLAYAINSGVQTAFGSMLPLVIKKYANTPGGCVIILGILTCIVGIVICGYAGALKSRTAEKEPEAQGQAAAKTKKPKFIVGMVVAIASGILCACCNLAFDFGGEIMRVSRETFHNPGWASTFAVWILVFWGGSVSSCLYCVTRLFRNRTWGNFTKPGIGRVLLLAAIMSVLHDGAVFLYGLGAYYLGVLGTSVGWAAFMSCTLIVGNVHGFVTKEWKGASRKSVSWIIAGIAVLVCAMCVLGKGNSMLPKPAPEKPPAAAQPASLK